MAGITNSTVENSTVENTTVEGSTQGGGGGGGGPANPNIDDFSFTRTEVIDAGITNMYGMDIRPDGTRMYSTRLAEIYQWDFGTPWDITTIGARQATNFGVVANFTGIQMNSVGSHAFIMRGFGTDVFYSALLANAYDLTDIDSSTTFSFASNPDSPWAIWVHPNDRDIFIVGTNGAATTSGIYHYRMNSANVATLASFQGLILDMTAVVGGRARGIDFSPDGLKMYISSDGTERIYQFNLTVAFDPSTATDSGLDILTSGGVDPRDIYVRKDTGLSMFTSAGGNTNTAVNEYTATI